MPFTYAEVLQVEVTRNDFNYIRMRLKRASRNISDFMGFSGDAGGLFPRLCVMQVDVTRNNLDGIRMRMTTVLGDNSNNVKHRKLVITLRISPRLPLACTGSMRNLKLR
jgi:hypothetical protein